MVSTVSDIGQSNDIINRIGALRKQLFEAQTQIATGKKTTTFGGLGTESQQLQSLRAESLQLDRFIVGINQTEIRINQMEVTLDSITGLAQQMLDGIRLQVQEGTIEIDSLQNVARANLDLLQDLINLEDNGRHLFAGTDISNPPYENHLTLTTNIQSEISDWFERPWLVR